jgi:sulfate permease, SulP family
MTIQYSLQNVLPNLHSLITEGPNVWRGELGAGITTAALLIPQSMAYAMLAGLPAQVGLYAALIPIVIYAILGSTKTLAVGPVAMDSLLTMVTLNGVAVSMSATYIEVAGLLALMVGVCLMLMSLLRVGQIVGYLGSAMMGGFTSAAAIMIGLSQLKHLLGISLGRHITAHQVIMTAFNQIDQVSVFTLIIGIISLLIFRGLPRVSPRVPSGLTGVMVMIGLGYLFNIEAHGVSVVGTIPEGLPTFSLPNIDRLKEILIGEYSGQILGGALSIALLAFMEAIAVGKAVAHDKGYEIKPGQELFALGASNMSVAFFGGYPVAGGFSRTAVNDRAGARTPLASVITFLAVGIVVWRLTPALYYLPHATLAAMIMSAVYGLIDFKMLFALIREDRIQALIWFSTFSVTLTLGLQTGIILGLVLSLLARFIKPVE